MKAEKHLKRRQRCSKEETISDDECLSSFWFDGNRYYDLPENLIEEAYVQKDGYVATILWFEGEVEEKE